MFNRAQIIGRLGKDPEIRYTQAGTPVASFSVATSETRKQDGEKIEKTEWHRVVTWEKLADICAQYLKKGSRVFIEGRLQTRSWEDKDGVNHSVTEIIASKMIMLDSKPQEASGSGGAGTGRAMPDDDIPF